jgi:hypothetical protein
MSSAKVTRAEWRWVLLVSLAVLLFASLPTIYAWWLADDAHVFSGFVYNTEDANSYIANMRQGARGNWLFHLPFTAEQHPGALLYTFYLMLGKVAASLGLSFQLTYHLARVALGLGLLVTVYSFVSRFVADVVTRRLAWLLAAIGSGLGWLLTVLGATHWLGNLPLDFWVPEAYVFLVLYSSPHLALAEGLLLWSMLWTLYSFEGRGLRWSLGAGLAAFAMAWIVPFYAGVLASVLGAFLLALCIRRRRFPWRELGLTALTGIGALAPVLYSAWLFTAVPAFATWAAQNRILSPHPLHYLLGFALLLAPAAWGSILALRQGEERWLLPLAWLLVVPFLLYAPFNLQRRMIAAAQVPLALSAARGLLAWLVQRRRVLVAYVAILSLSNILLVLGNLGPIHQLTTPIYRPAAEVAALEWLADHAQADETALASFETGNVVPAWTDLRAFAGHGPETLHNTEKAEDLEQFFDPATSDTWRQTLLHDFGLDYVFQGPFERELGNWDPSYAQYLVPVYRREAYVIYEVRLEKSQP